MRFAYLRIVKINDNYKNSLNFTLFIPECAIILQCLLISFNLNIYFTILKILEYKPMKGFQIQI